MTIIGGNVFNTEEMVMHIKTQNLLDNHKIQIIKCIINAYLTVRLHHAARTASLKETNIRHKYTKLILFQNQ